MEKASFGEKRAALQTIRTNTEKDREEELNSQGRATWSEYKKDADEYFAFVNPEWRTQVKSFFSELHKTGEKVVYLDICGTADGKRLGADKTINFSLKTPKNKKPRKDRILIEGDIFSRDDFRGLIDHIIREQKSPALVTFEPYAGLQSQLQVLPLSAPLPVSRDAVRAEQVKTLMAYQRLAKDLEKIIEVLRPGGFILIGDFFASRNQIEEEVAGIPRELETIAKRKNCSFEVSNSHDKFLMRKLATPDS